MSFISLKGYVTATYSEMISSLGNPCTEGSGDGKVETMWEVNDDIIVYDWKQYDGGARSRSGEPYRWHIGARNNNGVAVIESLVNKPCELL